MLPRDGRCTAEATYRKKKCWCSQSIHPFYLFIRQVWCKCQSCALPRTNQAMELHLQFSNKKCQIWISRPKCESPRVSKPVVGHLHHQCFTPAPTLWPCQRCLFLSNDGRFCLFSLLFQEIQCCTFKTWYFDRIQQFSIILSKGRTMWGQAMAILELGNDNST